MYNLLSGSHSGVPYDHPPTIPHFAPVLVDSETVKETEIPVSSDIESNLINMDMDSDISSSTGT